MDFSSPFPFQADRDLVSSWQRPGLFCSPSEHVHEPPSSPWASNHAPPPTDASSFTSSSSTVDADDLFAGDRMSPSLYGLPCIESGLLGPKQARDSNPCWPLPSPPRRSLSSTNLVQRTTCTKASHKWRNIGPRRRDQVASAKLDISRALLEPWPLQAVDVTVVRRLDEATQRRFLLRRLGHADMVKAVVETFRSKTRTSRMDNILPPTSALYAARQAAWYAKYRELLRYYQEHGHCNVPSAYPPNPSLSHWVKRQRSSWKRRRTAACLSLYQERIDLLNRLGFVWDMYKDAWESKYQLLLDYRREYGHTYVPMSVDTDPLHSKYAGLGVWVKSQRRHYQLLQRYGYAKSNLTPARVAQLDAIHFDWDPRNRKAEGTNFGLLTASGHSR